MYIQSSHLPSICPRKVNLWMEIKYQLLDGYLGPGLVWHWDGAFSRSSWLRDAVCCFVECTVPGCFPVFVNIPLSVDSRTHFKIIILIISLLSLFLLLLLLSLYLRNYLLFQKTPITFLCHLHKVFTICYIYKLFCRQKPIFVSQCSK